MNHQRPGRNIAAPASAPVLLVLSILLLLQSNSAAQNNSVYQTDARPATTSATLVSGSSQPFKNYQSVRDISAVGNRDIGCTHGMGNAYNVKALHLGQSYAHQVEATSKIITDPAIAGYVNRIAQNLVRNSDVQVQLTLEIIDTGEVNAFSLPGGFIFVDSGLILAADNEAELAGVISHEIAHVAACHAAQEMAREELTDVAFMPRIFRVVFRRAILNTIYLKPTRSFESEADFLGVEYLYKAGYDPRALSSFFEKVRAREKQNRSSRANAFDGHPQIADRIERTQQEINTLLPAASEYKLDTSEFQDIKKRLAELDNGHKLKTSGDGSALTRGSRTTADAATSNDVDPRRR